VQIFVKSGPIYSKPDQKDHQPIVHTSSNTFHHWRCFVGVKFACLSVTNVTYLSYTRCWNAVERCIFYADLTTNTSEWEVIIILTWKEQRPLGTEDRHFGYKSYMVGV